MREYEAFDQLLNKSKKIMKHTSDWEQMLFESLRMHSEADKRIYWLNMVGKEIDQTILYIDDLKNAHTNFTEKLHKALEMDDE